MATKKKPRAGSRKKATGKSTPEKKRPRKTAPAKTAPIKRSSAKPRSGTVGSRAGAPTRSSSRQWIARDLGRTLDWPPPVDPTRVSTRYYDAADEADEAFSYLSAQAYADAAQTARRALRICSTFAAMHQLLEVIAAYQKGGAPTALAPAVGEEAWDLHFAEIFAQHGDRAPMLAFLREAVLHDPGAAREVARSLRSEYGDFHDFHQDGELLALVAGVPDGTEVLLSDLLAQLRGAKPEQYDAILEELEASLPVVTDKVAALQAMRAIVEAILRDLTANGAAILHRYAGGSVEHYEERARDIEIQLRQRLAAGERSSVFTQFLARGAW